MKKLIKQIDGFDIYFEALPEDLRPSDIFDPSVDNIDELCDKINNGLLTWFCAKVTAEKAGVELGSDYLGGCCYKDEEDFLKDGYFDDMVQTILDEARKQLPELIKQLSE